MSTTDTIETVSDYVGMINLAIAERDAWAGALKEIAVMLDISAACEPSPTRTLELIQAEIRTLQQLSGEAAPYCYIVTATGEIFTGEDARWAAARAAEQCKQGSDVLPLYLITPWNEGGDE